MPQTEQTYKSHTRWLPMFHFFVAPVLLINALNAIRHVWLAPNRSTGFALLVAIALFVTALLSRVMAVTVQDRIIRLEMRLRLRELLPGDLQKRIADLKREQLVALRFAGDGELPDLVRQVLAGTLTKPKDIKLRVKDWQPDYLRA